jgi:hypothetical protein
VPGKFHQTINLKRYTGSVDPDANTRREEDDDPLGHKLLQSEDPLGHVAKLLKALEDLDCNNQNLWLLSFDVALRRGKEALFGLLQCVDC